MHVCPKQDFVRNLPAANLVVFHAVQTWRSKSFSLLNQINEISRCYFVTILTYNTYFMCCTCSILYSQTTK